MAQEEPTAKHHSQQQITEQPPTPPQQQEQGNHNHHQEVAEEEEEEEEEPAQEQKQSVHRQQQPESQHPKPTTTTSSSRKAFAFWAYLTLGITLLTLLLSSLHSTLLLHHDEPTWFLSLPDDLRIHYSSGRLLKDHRHPQAQIFTLDRGPRPSSAGTLLLLHGLAASSFSFRRVAASLASRGLRAVAPDLPGSGFSDALPAGAPEGVLSRVFGIFRDVREKGLFWGFDQLVEKGFVEYEEKGGALPGNSNSRYGPEEVAVAVGRAVDELGLEAVHLVLHDSALAPGMRWAVGNREKVRSVSFIDTSSVSAAFPSWMLGTPVLREVLLRFQPVFRGLLRLCCTRGIGEAAAEAYRMMLKGKDRQWGVVEHGRGLNYSFDLGEWAASEELKGLPMLVLWSHAWTDLWIDEGRRVLSAVPNAKFVQHFGGRWPQEDAAKEIADKLAEFVLSLPKSDREVKQEPPPELMQNMADKANEESSHRNDHHHGHSYQHVGDFHHQGHDHEHMAGFMDAYGLNPGWGT